MARKLKSKAISPDFNTTYISSKGTELPPRVDLDKYTALMNDVDVSTALRKFIDALFYNGYTITFTDKEEKNVSATKKLLRLYKFPRILRMVAVNLKLYGKAFIELVRKPMSVNNVVKNVVVELNVLHTPTIYPVLDKHGVVKKYIQQVGTEKIEFSTDELVELQILPSTAHYWGFYDIEGLYEIIRTKQLLEYYADFLFRNGKILPFWVVDQQIPDKAFDEFVSALEKYKDKPSGELVVQGKVDKKFFEKFQFLSDLENYLNHLRGKIFEYFGVPPIAAGFIEGANRSSADTQVRYVWNTAVLSFKNFLEFEINNILFPKIPLRAEIHFNPFDRLDLRDRIDNALKLKALGLSKETITKFLRNGVLPSDISWARVVESSKRERDKITNLISPSRQPRDPTEKIIRTGSEATTKMDYEG